MERSTGECGCDLESGEKRSHQESNRTQPYPHSCDTWHLCLCYFRINLTFESQQLWWLSNTNRMIWTSRRLLMPLLLCGLIRWRVCAWRSNLEWNFDWNLNSTHKNIFASILGFLFYTLQRYYCWDWFGWRVSHRLTVDLSYSKHEKKRMKKRKKRTHATHFKCIHSRVRCHQ